MNSTTMTDIKAVAEDGSGTSGSRPITPLLAEDTSTTVNTSDIAETAAGEATNDNEPLGPALRRSSRRKPLPVTRFDGIELAPATVTSEGTSESYIASRPKRKAAVKAEEAIASTQEDLTLLSEILGRMEPAEKNKYQGWVELESDPSFFQAMLYEMGAGDIKIMEFFTTDPEALSILPKPVHGLVFLYQCGDSDESAEERHDCPEGLWFANQTTANACATVALMNVAMNVANANFGPELQTFKDETASLSSPHKGHTLNTNEFIRSIHNTLARRTQLFSEELLVKNKHDDWEWENQMKSRKKKMGKKRASKGASRGNAGTKKKKTAKTAPDDTANHYIAYVPYDGKVWELDGLETKPLCLGPCTEGNWLQLALDIVNVRMTVINSQDWITYNLLAICKSPVSGLVDRLAVNLACAQVLDDEFGGTEGWSHGSLWDSIFPKAKLPAFGLAMDAINNAHVPQSFVDNMLLPDFDRQFAAIMMTELAHERDTIEAEYVNEMMFRDEAMEKWRGRQRDYTPSIHKLIETLHENDTLSHFLAKHSKS